MAVVKDSHQHKINSDDQEQQWVLKAQQKDSDAFECLYRIHVGKTYALCLRLCGDQAMAEDYTQEAFIMAWNKLHTFRGDSAFGSWLYRVAANVVMSKQRKKSNWFFKWFNQAQEFELLENSVDGCIDTTLDLEQAIKQLPKGARQVLVLYSVEGYRHEEIASLLGIAVGSSKAQLHRARSLLKQWCDYD